MFEPHIRNRVLKDDEGKAPVTIPGVLLIYGAMLLSLACVAVLTANPELTPQPQVAVAQATAGTDAAAKGADEGER